MGDDYEILGRDVLQDVADLLNDRGEKAAKKMRRLEQLYADWRRRESSFTFYGSRYRSAAYQSPRLEEESDD